MSECTFVTGLWNIDRGTMDNTNDFHDWNRSFEKYISQLEKLLSTGLNIVVYGDKNLEIIIDKYPNSKFIEYKKEEFYNLWFYNDVNTIRTSQCWYDQPSAQWLKGSPQAQLPLYIPISLSKLYFIQKTVLLNPFSSKKFYWLDAGITKNHDIQSLKSMVPKLLTYNNFIFFSHLYRDNTEIHGFLREGVHKYCGVVFVERIMKGFFFGGDITHIEAIVSLYNNIISNALKEGYLGTEETIFTIMTHKNPTWFDKVIISDCSNVIRFLQDEISFFYQCYKQPIACYHAIESIRKIYKDAPIFLFNDGGDSFHQQIANKFHNVYYEYCPRSSSLNVGNYPSNAENVKLYYNRLLKSMSMTTSKYMVLMEDDVIILNKIKTDALKYDLNGGHNMSHGDKINNYCKWWEKNTDIFHSGSGGSIIRTDFFRHILTDTIIANHFNIFFKDLRPGPAGIDLLTTFITYVCGGTVGQYSGYCETNWTEYTSRLQTNMIDCLHMFKYYYC